MTYGDSLPLKFKTDPTMPEDEWYLGDISSDIYDTEAFGSEPTLTLDNSHTYGTTMPTVKINHVGQTVLDVSLTDGSGVYNTAHHDVEVAVRPKNLYITTPSATKVYDGTPLTARGYYEDLAYDDVVDFSITGEQKDAGSSQNKYLIDWTSSSASQANYTTVDMLGRLTVFPRSTTMNLELSQDGKSAKATVGGFVGEDTPAGTVQFYINGEPNENPVSIAEDEGVYCAKTQFSIVPTGNYRVTAIFYAE